MVWRLLLLTLLVIVGVPVSAQIAHACTESSAQVTGCINNDGVDLHGNGGNSGGGGNNNAGGGGNNNGGGGSNNTGGDGPIMKCMEAVCPSEDDCGSRSCWGVEEPVVVTISDIERFIPRPPRQQMEPDGWTVPGLDTNFYAITNQHVVAGELLGQPAFVRFTPFRYHWTYGDGHASTRGTKGGTWKSLGLREFDRTPTSHIYARDGNYTIRLHVDYLAEYRWANSGYIPIDGFIPLRANDLHIVAGGAKTLLFEHDCVVNPGGPGC